MAEKPDSKPSAPAPAPSTAGPDSPPQTPGSAPHTPAPGSDPAPTTHDSKEAPAMASSDLKTGNECPKCGNEAERYHGDNPHKIGSYWCGVCGERRPIKS